MKDLSIEEKAKAYDALFVKAQRIYNKENDVLILHTIEDLFPELKESKDEKIRKWLIDTIKAVPNDSIEWENIDKSDVLAWLEKQYEQKPADVDYNPFDDFRKSDSEINPSEFDARLNALLKEFESLPKEELVNSLAFYLNVVQNDGTYNEQKPADKIEPKFKVEEGKWYVCISQFCNCIEGRVYKAISDSRIIDDFGTEYDMHIDAYKYFRLWTIQDAKDGDVLAIEWNQDNDVWEKILIFKALNDNGVEGYGNTFKNKDLFFTDEKVPYYSKTWTNTLHPATKEQRDQLEKAMTNAGYKWNKEERKLEKI